MNYSPMAREFLTQGYTIVRNVVPSDDVARFRTVFENIQTRNNEGKMPSAREMMLTYLFDEVTELHPYLFSGKVLAALHELLGKSIWCLPESLLHCNRYFDWHKDSSVMDFHGINYHHTAESTIVQLGLYFQDNAVTGGGLYLTRGSHLKSDRFILPGQSNGFSRLRSRMTGDSLNNKIERNEMPVAPDVKAGDIILFDYRLDHRASFQRNLWGRPKRLNQHKYAVFSQFSGNEMLLRYYLDAIVQNPGLYAAFLKTYKLPESLKLMLLKHSLNSVIA